jgi:hypothetical protein
MMENNTNEPDCFLEDKEHQFLIDTREQEAVAMAELNEARKPASAAIAKATEEDQP